MECEQCQPGSLTCWSLIHHMASDLLEKNGIITMHSGTKLKSLTDTPMLSQGLIELFQRFGCYRRYAYLNLKEVVISSQDGPTLNTYYMLSGSPMSSSRTTSSGSTRSACSLPDTTLVPITTFCFSERAQTNIHFTHTPHTKVTCGNTTGISRPGKGPGMLTLSRWNSLKEWLKKRLTQAT